MPPKIFPNLARPLLFAHRGASAMAPENTMEAFDLAARLGADVLELDVHLTQDNEVVVLHDATVERTTDGHGSVADMTYKQVSRFDAGFRFKTPDGAQPFLGRGCIVPRLQDVLMSFSKMAFNIEIKPSGPNAAAVTSPKMTPPIIAQVVQLLQQSGVQAILTSADPQVMQHLENAQSGYPLGLSSAQVKQILWAAVTGWTVPLALHGRALQIPPRWRGIPVATSLVLRLARRCAMPVHIWTINDPRTAESLLARGVDGIMSDDPALLAQSVPAFANRSVKP